MKPESPRNPEPPEDGGEVVSAHRAPISWVWLFPALALAATAWLFWTNWRDLGPEITIHFDEAPGIQPGKTNLKFRGVQAGKVASVQLDPDLGGVLVKVRLHAFAAKLAREDTIFWIEEPVFSVKGVAGVESIIQGNAIQALQRGTGTKRQLVFQGMAEAPVNKSATPVLMLSLRADDIPFVARGAPVHHRGVAVGWVREKRFGEDGRPIVDVVISRERSSAVRSNARFWIEPATALRAGPGRIQLELSSLASLVNGGIAFDHFTPGGEEVEDGAEFELSRDEAAARADGPRMQVDFDDGTGLISGQSRVTYLGQPVGLVESLVVSPTSHGVEATVRLRSDFAPRATEGSVFKLVRPSIGLDGVSGLEAIVTGPYIAFEPGPASDVRPTRFLGSSTGGGSSGVVQDGIVLTLRADSLPTMGEGAPLYYRGLPAGRVLSARPGAQGQPELKVMVDRAYRDKVRANVRFWRVPATSVDLGAGFLQVRLQGLSALWQGGVAFDVFGEEGPLAEPNTAFTLLENEQLAAAVSPPVRITFDDGRGLQAGRTQLRYLGLPVGIVESVRVLEGKVEVMARFRAGFDFLRRRGSEFAVMRPDISLQNVSGLETLVSGVYIACAPGRGSSYADNFSAMDHADMATLGEPGFTFKLVSGSTRVAAGAAITYNETQVGSVLDKTLSPDGKQVILTAEVRPAYRQLVRADSKFWDASAINAKLGIFRVEIKTPNIVTSGRVAFTTPDSGAEPAPQGATFTLLPKPPRP